jgi:N6-adenosine-specific RNA methylase IME4
MKINIKRIPDESTQVVNGKTHYLARNSEPKVVVTLIGNPKGFCMSTQIRLEGQGNRLLIELKKISPECCQKIESPCKPRIRVNKPSSLAVDIMLKRFTNTEIKLVP